MKPCPSVAPASLLLRNYARHFILGQRISGYPSMRPFTSAMSRGTRLCCEPGRPLTYLDVCTVPYKKNSRLPYH
jgi:hypothetical protein